MAHITMVALVQVDSAEEEMVLLVVQVLLKQVLQIPVVEVLVVIIILVTVVLQMERPGVLVL